jgi:hypothetical protein
MGNMVDAYVDLPDDFVERLVEAEKRLSTPGLVEVAPELMRRWAGKAPQALLEALHHQYKKGIEKYGVPLYADTGLDCEAHAAMEAADLAVYLSALKMQNPAAAESFRSILLTILSILD